jgi:arabinose-5-phosphate isomerase
MEISLLDRAKEVFRIESDGILGLEKLLDHNFTDAVEAILSSNGKVIVTGMGKSGIIGAKIASTFSSTGTSSFFMHPSEAFHGDLGMLQENDILLMLSYSGETEEVIRLLPYAKESQISVVSITGAPKSTLATNSNFHICATVGKEACHLQLAPTASTTATLAVGDALAISLMQLRDFKPENFAQYHPGGSLGKRLLLKVQDVMYTENLPVIKFGSMFIELAECMADGNQGVVAVSDEEGDLCGIVSSGDMIRAMKKEKSYKDISINQIMTEEPICADTGDSLEYAEKLMKDNKITVLFVKRDNKLVGVIQLNQCLL